MTRSHVGEGSDRRRPARGARASASVLRGLELALLDGRSSRFSMPAMPLPATSRSMSAMSTSMAACRRDLGDAAAHLTGAEHSDASSTPWSPPRSALRRPSQCAMPSPPPMHSDGEPPRRLLVLAIAYSSVTRMRAPDAPIGWPSATAPPRTLTFARSSSSSCCAAMVTHGEGLVDLPEVDVGVLPAQPARAPSRWPGPARW